MYYAMYSPYGIRTINRSDQLLRFTSKRDRDKWINDEVFDGSNYHVSSLTYREARRLFPEAFYGGDSYMSNDLYYPGLWRPSPELGNYGHVSEWTGSRKV